VCVGCAVDASLYELRRGLNGACLCGGLLVMAQSQVTDQIGSDQIRSDQIDEFTVMLSHLQLLLQMSDLL
jgi:hypothetical protein